MSDGVDSCKEFVRRIVRCLIELRAAIRLLTILLTNSSQLSTRSDSLQYS